MPVTNRKVRSFSYGRQVALALSPEYD